MGVILNQYLLTEEVSSGDKRLINIGYIIYAEPTNAGANTMLLISGRTPFGPASSKGNDYEWEITSPFQEIIDTLDRANKWPVNALYP